MKKIGTFLESFKRKLKRLKVSRMKTNREFEEKNFKKSEEFTRNKIEKENLKF